MRMVVPGSGVVGVARYPNLWLNAGHGTLGWTMGCGPGRVVPADLISRRRPEIATAGLDITRYARPA
jgi:D-amino-acid dehydrogenase